MRETDIAVVGMGCVFPGAADLGRFLANTVDGVDAITAPPPDRLNGQLNFRPFVPCLEEISRPVTWGGFIPADYRFDPLRYGVLPKNVRDGDPDQFLALAVIDAALGDAGIAADDAIRERCDVIMGRGGYMTNKMAEGYVHVEFLPHLLLYLRRELPDWSADRFAEFASRLRGALPADGGADSTVTCMPNLAASRAANRLDLRGAAYTVDGACASSLLAVEHAVVRLRAGLCDAAVACGLQLVQLPSFWAVFAQLGALSPGNVMRPFDRGADGLLVGEGGGAVVLKRLVDARRAGDRVYAVIRGVGTSSDGRGTAILTPNWRGQVDALRRAYADAGVDPSSIGYLEAHGTATLIGDPVEAHTITTVYGERGSLPPTRALGSVKSMIGHLMAGAGIASFIRAVLAVSNKVLPPSLNCDDPIAGLDPSTFYVNAETRPWIHPAGPAPRRAGVNAFGFGGLNVHVVLEEVPETAGAGPLPRPVTCPGARGTELFAWSAAAPEDLAGLLERTAAAIDAACRPTLAELSAAVLREAGPGGTCRLALLASSRDGLRDALRTCIDRLRDAAAVPDDTGTDVFFANAPPAPGRVAAVFPGLSFPGVGGAYGEHLVELCIHFPELRRLFDTLERRDGHPEDPVPTSLLFAPPRTLAPEWKARLQRRIMLPQLSDLRVAAAERPAAERLMPVAAVATANWLGWRLLETLGVAVDCVVGQSMGELSACTAAGVFGIDDMAAGLWAGMDVPAYRDAGQLAAVFGSEEQIRPHLDAVPGVHLAVHVAPRMQVLGGPTAVLEPLLRRLAGQGIIGQLLAYPPVHTPECDFLNETVTRAMEAGFRSFREPRLRVYSCADGVPYPRDIDDMRAVVVRLLNHPVRFWQTIRRMRDEGVRVFIEAGNGGMASTVRATLGPDEAEVVAVDDEAVEPLTQVHRLCARLFTAGVPVELDALHRHRGLRRLDLGGPAVGVADAAAALEMPLRLSVLPFGADVYEQGLAAVRAGDAAAESARDRDPGDESDGDAPSGPPGRMPFVGEVVEHVEGERIVVERILDLDRDLFLHDHVFILVQDHKPLEDCLPVVPAAALVEAMAEVAQLLVPDLGVIGLEQMKALRWVALDGCRTLPIRVAARVDAVDADTGAVTVRAELFAAGEARASATVRLGAAYEQTLAPTFSPRDGSRPWYYTAAEIYRDRHAFHGPRLQCLVGSGATGAGGGDGTLEVLPVADWFADEPRPHMLLDVAILDGVAQALGGWTRGYGRFSVPLGFEKLELYRHTPPPGTRCTARLEMVKGGERSRAFVFDVEVEDGTGHVWMRIRNFTMWAFDIPPRAAEALRKPAEVFLSDRRDLGCLPEDVVAVRLGGADLPGFKDEWLGRACLTGDELATLRAIATPRRRRQWFVGRLAAKDAVRIWFRERHGGAVVHPLDFEIRTDERGRPCVWPIAILPGLPAISIAHTGDTAYALAGAGPVGIDVEPADRAVDEIAPHFVAADERRLLGDAGADADALLRLWCAKEAVGKAVGTGLGGRPGDFMAVSSPGDGGLIVAHGPSATHHAVATALDDGFVVAFTPAVVAGRRPRGRLGATPDAGPEPPTLAVFGAGVMGSGIAGVAAEAGLSVALIDVDAAVAERGRRLALADCGCPDGSGPADAVACPAALLRAETDPDAAAGADVVIESIVEDATAKRTLYARLEPALGPDAILTTNTSSIRVATLARDLARPERFCGLHFFNPIRRLRLVEVVRCPATSDATVAAAVAFVRRIGGRPLVVGDGPGFLVNRLLFPFMNEAVALLVEGATVREVDEAVTALGLPLGPIGIYDLVGLDVSFRVGRNFWMAFPDRVVLSAVVPTLVRAGRLGRKAGRGFYAYDETGLPHDDPAVEPIIRRCRTGDRRISADEIVQRLLLATLLEATRLIDDGIVADVGDIDVALVEGAGFPPELGGLLAWADSVGAAAILDMLEPFAGLGPRMQPTPRLLRMAATGATFCGGARRDPHEAEAHGCHA